VSFFTSGGTDFALVLLAGDGTGDPLLATSAGFGVLKLTLCRDGVVECCDMAGPFCEFCKNIDYEMFAKDNRGCQINSATLKQEEEKHNSVQK
jgi:hypothetical protein